MLFKIAALFCTVGLTAASYPDEFPFESESTIPAAPLASTPSLTFDENDPGGYLYTYAYMWTMTDEEFTNDFDSVFTFMKNKMYVHQAVVRNGAELSQIGDDYYNCTASGNVYSGASYNGVIGEDTICGEGECCKDWWGTVSFYFVAEPYDPYYADWAQILTDGGCGDAFGEHVYCTIFAAQQNVLCMEQYATPTDRLVVYPCYDSLFHYYMDCAVYKVTGYMFRPQTEPEQYLEETTAEEKNACDALYFSPDKVCHPYSYYYPETAKSTEASGSASSADSAESGSVESSSAASYFVVGLVASLMF